MSATPGDPERVSQALRAGALNIGGKSCWGPPQWHAIHQLLRGYPDTPSAEKQNALRQYMKALAVLLPCTTCSEHFSKLADTVDPSSRLAAIKWSIDAHNTVNARLNKPVLDWAQAVDAMTKGCLQHHTLAQTSTKKPSPLLVTTIVLAVLLLACVAALVALSVSKHKKVRAPFNASM